MYGPSIGKLVHLGLSSKWNGRAADVKKDLGAIRIPKPAKIDVKVRSLFSSGYDKHPYRTGLDMRRIQMAKDAPRVIGAGLALSGVLFGYNAITGGDAPEHQITAIQQADPANGSASTVLKGGVIKQTAPKPAPTAHATSRPTLPDAKMHFVNNTITCDQKECVTMTVSERGKPVTAMQRATGEAFTGLPGSDRTILWNQVQLELNGHNIDTTVAHATFNAPDHCTGAGL